MQNTYTLSKSINDDNWHMVMPVRRDLVHNTAPSLPTLLEEGKLSLNDELSTCKPGLCLPLEHILRFHPNRFYANRLRSYEERIGSFIRRCCSHRQQGVVWCTARKRSQVAEDDEVNRHRAHLGAHPTSAAFKDRSLPTHLCTHLHHPSLTLHSPTTSSSLLNHGFCSSARQGSAPADEQNPHSRWPPVPFCKAGKRFPRSPKMGPLPEGEPPGTLFANAVLSHTRPTVLALEFSFLIRSMDNISKV